MTTLKSLLTVLALLAATTGVAQRRACSINEGWQFRMAGDEAWQTTTLPHTWNALDAFDDTPGYQRGEGIYRRQLTITPEQLQQRLVLRFEGAQTVATLYVNGQQAGRHTGGYTAFGFDVTSLLHAGSNDIEVRVDNSYMPDVSPLSADFTFYGGIYRDVELLELPAVHISATHYGSSGVYVSTPTVSATTATLSVQTMLDNADLRRQNVVVEHRLIGPDGQCAAQTRQKIRLEADALHQPHQASLEVANPALWDIEHPQLYRLQTRLLTTSGEVMDEVVSRVGIRHYAFSTQEGFTLNGRKVKLVGTNRHQDYPTLGNALADEMHTRDIEQIKQMGSNFLRISHYPQDPLVTDACDRLGIITSVEIPVINTITMSEAFSDNCNEMLKEMIYQNYNSPSVCIWAFMNEILLVPAYNSDPTIDRQQYLQKVHEYTTRMHQTAKALDPARATMLPCHTAFSSYAEAGLFDITDILGFNTYDGWYQGEFTDFERNLDHWHSLYPDKPFFVSEYGADNDARVHSFKPVRFDYSEEYSTLFHQHYLPAILERPYINGCAVWNYNDFGSEARGYAVPHTNLKGLVTGRRQPKDSYLYYQAMLLDEPFLRIGGSDWPSRSDVPNTPDGRCCVRPVQVFTNQPEVTLVHNGQTLGTQKASNGTATFDVAFVDGQNTLAATSGQLTDVLRIGMRLVPQDLGQFTSLNVLMGSERHFFDPISQLDWMPDQPYATGSWGYVDGQAFAESNWAGQLPTSSLNILGTENDPIYQTQRRGLKAFRADVPDGEYVVYLHFCELDGGTKEALAYELGNSTVVAEGSDRVFDVSINGTAVIRSLDVAASCGVTHPMVKRIPVTVSDGQGLCIGFEAVKGETMLTAIRILRL